MSKFKVGDMVTVTRAIITRDEPYVGKIFKVKTEHELGVYFEGNGFTNEQLQLVEKAKPTIINLPNCKIVINKPYIIVTDGKHTGKAKCNPEDVWSVEKGMELAADRFKVTKFNKEYAIKRTVSTFKTAF